MTIYEIGILTHYYCCTNDHEHMVRNPPAWRPTIEMLQTEKLIEREDESTSRCYRLTDRGRVFVDAIQNVPLPQSRWFIRWPADGEPMTGGR